MDNESVQMKPKPFEAPETQLFQNVQAIDAFGQPSNMQTIPLPLDVSFVTANGQIQMAPAIATPVQMPETVPQQQLPDTYALPISNQPQLQQHLLQQQAMVEGVPMAVYNPSYLVQQSSNLLHQHRERLFKPAPSFFNAVNQPNVNVPPSDGQSFSDANSVASPGQFLASYQNEQKHGQQPPNEFDASNAQSMPSSYQAFEQYVQKPANDIIVGRTKSPVQQPTLSERELANLMSYGSSQRPATEQGFVASSYYQTQPDQQQIEVEDVQRQRQNDITINQANAEVKKKSVRRTSTTTQRPHTQRTSTARATAYDIHQKRVADTLDGRTKLMIVVPDDKVRSNH